MPGSGPVKVSMPSQSEQEEQYSKDPLDSASKFWPKGQGVKVIQNRSILKERQNIQGGQYFQEGPVLGDSHFEKPPLALDDIRHSPHSRQQSTIRERAISKLKDRNKQKYDFES